ncbi:MAG: Lpg1974 family pore-forming outer membrane protein [Bacteroidales bacterium]
MRKRILLTTAMIWFTFSFSQSVENKPYYTSRLIKESGFRLQEYQDNNDNGNEPEGKLDFNFFVLPNLIIGGAPTYLGSEVELFDESSSAGNLPDDVLFDASSDYGDKTVPIITNPETGIPFNIDIGYTYNDTRIGLSWFRMTASDEQTGEVPGLDLYSEDNTEGFGYGFVSFWNMGWDLHSSRNFPASWAEGFRDLGEIEDGDGIEDGEEIENGEYQIEYSPDQGNSQWESSHDISFNSIQLSVRHPVIKSENLTFSLMGGLQYGRWSDNLKQTLNITAHTELTDRWTQLIPVDEQGEDSVMVEVFLDYIFNNDITLETNSSSEFNSFGLIAGIEADWKILPSLSVSVKAGTSTLSGSASYSGTGIDVDDIVEEDILTVYDMDGNQLFTDPLEGYEYLSGEFTLPEYSKDILSVNYFLNFTTSYEITDIVSLMAGYSYSLWKNLPMSPQWSYSDAYTQPYGPYAVEDSWDKEKISNISASGFKLGIGLTF